MTSLGTLDPPFESRPAAEPSFRPAPSARPVGWRRWTRFNLLTFLVAFLVLTTYLGVRQRFVVSGAEHAAEARLAEKGARFTYVPAGPPWMQVVFLQFGDDFRHVESVKFDGPIADDFLRSPEKFELSADDLSAFAAMPRLRYLDLSNQLFDERGLASVGACESLESLMLVDTLVNDAGVANLESLRKLRQIQLTRTLTSDGALATLAKLPALEEVYLDDGTTADGIAALVGAGPSLRSVRCDDGWLHVADFEPLHRREGMMTSARVERGLSFARASGASGYGGGHFDLFVERPPGPEISDVLPEYPVSLYCGTPRAPAFERIAELACDSRVASLRLDFDGPPIRYSEIARAMHDRPKDACPCIVHGHVLISGAELVALAAQAPSRSTPGTSAWFELDFVIYDLDAEDLEALSEAARVGSSLIVRHERDPWATRPELHDLLSARCDAFVGETPFVCALP